MREKEYNKVFVRFNQGVVTNNLAFLEDHPIYQLGVNIILCCFHVSSIKSIRF